MGIFGNKDKSEPLGSLFEDDELEQVVTVDYNSALDWVTGLSDEDYKKFCSVADIYRKAQQEAATALGVENEPTTFITVPVDETVQTMEGKVYPVDGATILDDDEDIAAILDEPEFIATDEKTKKSKQIEVDGK